ncbi:glycosyltransferase like 2 family protein [Methyloversatilis sp. RAC08]|uniref:glycosyltransferase family 2 protein n=1 Tax=Methyloversatilis sp. RAC08 TaxID=1842540 RepID=UPI0008583FF3|nr:glycosyltransferase family A protein [Methyloversatilis sp. RAC08]AOF83141.1 glycosyltransferase like 2 family protein [Methyloversatilis sp. RAC08]
MSTVLSVIIPAHNAARWIAAAIDSVRTQALPTVPDIIVVTDRCSDQTANIALATGARIIDSPTAGPSAARNAGVAASHSRYIAFLDADDLWPPDSCAARLALLDATPDAAMVFGDCRQFDDRDGNPHFHAHTLFVKGGRDVAFFGDAARVVDALDKLLDADFITTGTVIMRREAFDALGGFDSALQRVEDLDLWLRVAARFPLIWHAQTALWRRRHGDNLSRDTRAMHEAYIAVLARLKGLPQARHLEPRIRTLQRREHRALARQAILAGQPLRAMTHVWQGVRA